MSNRKSAPRLANGRDLLDLGRLVFLIDGVFAITLTLLILDLKVTAAAGQPLGAALLGLLPRLAIYLFAFATIANQWAIHHRTFRLVQHADGTLVQFSLVNLLFITLIPASAAVVGSYPDQRLAAACFGINSLLLCVSAAAVWWYVATNSYLLAEKADPRILRGIVQIWLFVAAGFALALIVGAFSIYGEYALWVAWSPIVRVWWDRRRRQLGA